MHSFFHVSHLYVFLSSLQLTWLADTALVTLVSQTQDIVTKINILLQEICDIELQNKKNNMFNVHKNHPKGTGGENVQGDTHLICNSTSLHLSPYKKSIPTHHAPNPNHVPNTGDSTFTQQKQVPYKLLSTSPPESLSSSSSNEDSMDNSIDHAGYDWTKTGLPWKRVGRGEGELEMEGEQETRGGMEEECLGPSSGAVTKLSGPELGSESGHYCGRGQLLEAGEGEGHWAAKWRGHVQGR